MNFPPTAPGLYPDDPDLARYLRIEERELEAERAEPTDRHAP